MRKLVLVLLFAGLTPVASIAQSWSAGAAVGLVNDVERRFRLDDFDPHDVALWVDFALADDVTLRGTFGSLRVKGDNAGRRASVIPGAPPSELPDLKTRIDYATVAVSYEFWEGDYTSGIFAGLGGYKIRPESAPEPFAAFRDPSQTVLGWHGGVEGRLRVVSRVSLVARFTYHGIKSDLGRNLLTADAGLSFRF